MGRESIQACSEAPCSCCKPRGSDVGGAGVVALAAAAPALAAPEWGIEMTHANAYGLQAGECPGGKDIYVPGEPAKDCGVDPFTGSGTTFARESGFNTYTITVKNTAPASSGPGPGRHTVL